MRIPHRFHLSLEKPCAFKSCALILSSCLMGSAGALETARCLRRRAAADADAAGLLALLLVAQPAEPQQPSSQQAGGEEEASMVPPRPAEAAAAAADCCCQLLTADPFCHTAAAALLALNEQHPLPPTLLVSGCCAYLEAQPPAWLPPLLELRGEVDAFWCGQVQKLLPVMRRCFVYVWFCLTSH